MYCPEIFAEQRPEVLQALVQDHPLAILVTRDGERLEANHIPLLLSVDAGSMSLHGHLARANPLWRDQPADGEVLVIFQGPQLYISPSWYATKKETGRVVPTWNYIVAHVYGSLQIHDDPAWIRQQMGSLTAQQEASLAEPWQVADAPRDFTERLIQQVTGIEIPITRWLGKWKVSQNQPGENQESIWENLKALGEPQSQAMAGAVRRATGDLEKGPTQ